MNWVIVTEPYREFSNGVQIMHRLCHQLNRAGERAFLIFLDWHADASKRQLYLSADSAAASPDLTTPFLTKDIFTEEFARDAVVVYPDALVGNPLGATRIVRYLGNRPGHCTPGHVAQIEPEAFVIAHSQIFVPNPHAVLFNGSIDPVFFERGAPNPFWNRDLDLVYHGKATLSGTWPVFRNTLLVQRNWPQGRAQLALLLKRCRYFYTYDCWSNINAEAIAAGAVPIFMRWDPWTREEIEQCEVAPVPQGRVVEIRKGVIDGSVDRDRFVTQRREFLQRMRDLEDGWEQRVAETIVRMREYFS